MANQEQAGCFSRNIAISESDGRAYEVRWAAASVPTAAAMLASGHKSAAGQKRYQNLQKAEIKNAFRNLSRNCPEENQQDKEKTALLEIFGVPDGI